MEGVATAPADRVTHTRHSHTPTSQACWLELALIVDIAERIWAASRVLTQTLCSSVRHAPGMQQRECASGLHD